MISLPAWSYFIVSDALWGRSVGKRILGVRTLMTDGGLPTGRAAVVRTAVELAPWELTHLVFFGLLDRIGTFGPVQLAGMALTYALIGMYMAMIWRTRGQRSVNDWIAATRVTVEWGGRRQSETGVAPIRRTEPR